MQPDQQVVIIGNGIAGITLAQRLRAVSNCRITVISAESQNHFSRPALMYVYMGHMRYEDIIPYPEWYWQQKQITQVQDRVQQIDFKTKTLHCQSGNTYTYDALVLATGSDATFHNWPGQQLKGVQALVSLQDLELMQRQTEGTKQAVIVGGGLIGVEMAEMLQSKGVEVTMLVREKLYWRSNLPEQEAALVSEHIQQSGIRLLFQTELAEIKGSENGHVSSVITSKGAELPCQFVGIATGVKPAIDFLQPLTIETDKGILVDRYFKTSQPDVYAIGDCAQFRDPLPGEPSLEQLWYTGRQHAEALAQTLAGTPTAYARGPWFDSAKFLNLEYQTYGFVPRTWNENIYTSLYWEHPQRAVAIRLFYEKESGLLRGINLLGVRYRHDLCHYWLAQKYTIHQVMQELPAANFDPEFFQRYEQELLRQYYEQYPEKQEPRKYNTWWKLRHRIPFLSESSENC